MVHDVSIHIVHLLYKTDPCFCDLTPRELQIPKLVKNMERKKNNQSQAE